MSWQPAYRLSYNGRDITADINDFVLGVTYVDNLSGEADELNVELEDTDGRWLNAWYPEHGAALTLALGYEGEALMSMGEFDLDELECSGPPSVVRIRALAAGLRKPVRSRRSRGYEQTSLDKVVARVARRMGVQLQSEIDPIPLDRLTQYQESDLQFLTRLADEYGYICKLMDNGTNLVFWRRDERFSAEPLLRLTMADVSSWSVTDKVGEVPVKVTTQYHQPEKKQLMASTVADGETALVPAEGVSSSADEVKLSRRAGSQQAADAQARAELDRRALERTRVELSLPGDPTLLAGAMIELAEWGRLSGRYVINQARHELSRSQGYGVTLRLARTAPAEEPANE